VAYTHPSFTYNPRFPGQVFDKESGLHFNHYRDYDAQIGRYIQSDPIGLAGGINTYGYVGGMPTLYVDPDGLKHLLVNGVSAGGGGGGGYGGMYGGGGGGGGRTAGASPRNPIAMASPIGRKKIRSIPDKIKLLCTPNDKDPCEQQQEDDEADCGRDYGSVFGWGSSAYRGCMERAMINADLCRRGRPPVPKWSDRDVTGEPKMPKPPSNTP
jgi:RHS repeat-associated protein